MMIRGAKLADVERCAAMRAALWPEGEPEEHRGEASATLAWADADSTVFVAVDDQDEACGVAEASVRRDYVNGCDTSPVAFLEGVYVEPAHRGQGLGRALCQAVEAWGRERGCRELGSDAALDNSQSQAFHAAAGFEETERVVFFRKRLDARHRTA